MESIEAAPGGGGAMDPQDVDGGEIFFKGSISEAIVRAQATDFVLIVFVAGRVCSSLFLWHEFTVLVVLQDSFLQLTVMWRGCVISAGENEESVSMELTTFCDSAVGFKMLGL